MKDAAAPDKKAPKTKKVFLKKGEVVKPGKAFAVKKPPKAGRAIGQMKRKQSLAVDQPTMLSKAKFGDE